jgi:hypothetical protein
VDEALPDESVLGDPETEETFGVQDSYTPSDRTEEPE